MINMISHTDGIFNTDLMLGIKRVILKKEPFLSSGSFNFMVLMVAYNIHQFNKVLFYRFSIELHKASSNMLVGCDYEITMNPLI